MCFLNKLRKAAPKKVELTVIVEDSFYCPFKTPEIDTYVYNEYTCTCKPLKKKKYKKVLKELKKPCTKDLKFYTF
jgi:hypothetical protein